MYIIFVLIILLFIFMTIFIFYNFIYLRIKYSKIIKRYEKQNSRLSIYNKYNEKKELLTKYPILNSYIEYIVYLNNKVLKLEDVDIYNPVPKSKPTFSEKEKCILKREIKQLLNDKDNSLLELLEEIEKLKLIY